MRRFLLVIALLPIFCVACKEKQKQAGERVVSVNISVIDEDVFGEQRTYVGVVEEAEAVALSFEAGGNVKEVFVKVGDKVSAGQLLARLDKGSAENAYAVSKSTLEQAEDGYNRAKQLYDSGSLPEVKWIDIQTKLAQAQSMERIARRSLENCDLYAPVSGVVGNKNIEVGSNVTPFAPVFKLLNINQLKVKTSIPENEIAKIRLKDKANVVVPALSTEIISAEVVEKSIEADILSHSYAVKCIFNDKHKNLLPGMVCKVSINLPEEAGFVIPANVVQTTPNGLAVWTIKNNRAKRQKISSSKYVVNGILVQEGLCKGDTIIVEGYQKLYDDAKVSINKQVE